MVSSKFELSMVKTISRLYNIVEKSQKANVNAKFNSVNIYRYQGSEKKMK